MSYCHTEKAKTLCTPKKAKLLIALVGLFSLIYNIPAYCEHKYEKNINGTISSAQTYLAKHELYKLVYRAWIGFIVRFVIPTICLVVFNVKIIRKVSYRLKKMVLGRSWVGLVWSWVGPGLVLGRSWGGSGEVLGWFLGSHISESQRSLGTGQSPDSHHRVIIISRLPNS